MKKSITKTNTRITEEQKKQYFSFVKDAAEHALKETDLDKNGLQKIIKNGDKLKKKIVTFVRKFSLKNNRFADEEMESDYGYFSGYKPKEITKQINLLRKLFPGIGYADEKLAEQDLPPNAEGWFAIPRWEKIAPTYGRAVEKVIDLINQTRNHAFYNHAFFFNSNFKEHLNSKYLRQSKKTREAFQKLGDKQKGYDILVVSAQFGLRHRGRSVRRAYEVMNANEFGLGVFAVGIMLLTHPKRLQHRKDLKIDCAGDEFSQDANGDFSGILSFEFDCGMVELSRYWVGGKSDRTGSASGFLSQ